jgi:Ca2+:H+ antiporter
MGESFTVQQTPSNNVSSSILPNPAANADDDDEPPGNSANPVRSLEITKVSNATHREQTVHGEEKRIFPFFPNRLSFDPEKQGRRTNTDRTRFACAPRLRALFTPSREIGPQPTYRASALNALKYSPLNICLVFIPISWALHFTNQSATMVFVFSAVAIIPLAALLGLGTEQIALRTSASVGGLLNATLGNVVELIIAGIALKQVSALIRLINQILTFLILQCELELVQSSLLGGLLSNLLLVLGMAFIVGGFRFHQQEFQPMAAQLNSSLMIVSVISLLVPAAFVSTMK